MPESQALIHTQYRLLFIPSFVQQRAIQNQTSYSHAVFPKSKQVINSITSYQSSKARNRGYRRKPKGKGQTQKPSKQSMQASKDSASHHQSAIHPHPKFSLFSNRFTTPYTSAVPPNNPPTSSNSGVDRLRMLRGGGGGCK